MKQKGTHEYKECVYILLDVCDSVFIDLANEVIESCPSCPFGFDSYTLDPVHFTLYILFRYRD